MTIEDIIHEEKSKEITKGEKAYTPNEFFKNDIVAVSAGNLFYTPIMTVLEHYVAHKPYEEVTSSRLAAMTLSLATAYPLTKFSDYWQQKHNYHTKPWQTQCAIDISGLLIPHIPLYGAILASTSESIESSIVALVSSLPVVILSAYPYRKFLHQWRKLWNAEPFI